MTSVLNWIRNFFKEQSTKELLALAGILGLTILLRLTFIHEPFERDEGTYAYLGQEILRGAIPYKEVIEIKPPGMMYIYASMIGLFGLETSEGIRIVTAFYVLGTVVSVYWLARYLFGVRAGLLAGLLYAIFSSGPVIQGSSCNSENFLVLPLMFSACYMVRWLDTEKRYFLVICGFFSVLAMLIKTVALPHVVLILFFLMIRQIRRLQRSRDMRFSLTETAKDVAAFALFPIIIYAVVIAYLSSQGALNDAVYWNYTFLKKYGSNPLDVYLARLTGVTSHMATEHLLLWILAVPGFYYLLFKERNSRNIFAALLVLTAFAGLSMPGKFFPHYYIQLIPPLALVAGIGFSFILRSNKYVLCLYSFLIIGGTLLWMKTDYKFYFTYSTDKVCVEKYGRQGQDFVNSVPIAAYIKQRTSSEDFIYLWNWEPQIYYLSGRRAPIAYNSPLLVQWSESPLSSLAELFQALLTSKVKYIVVDIKKTDSYGWPSMLNILQTHYFIEASFGDYYLFRLKKAL